MQSLCKGGKYTCWLKGGKPEADSCPLISQEGYIYKQSCKQPVRWVCRKPCERVSTSHAGVAASTCRGDVYMQARRR